MTPEVTSVVVVAFHRPESLSILLDSLRNRSGIEIVVVNIEADPAVAEVVASFQGTILLNLSQNVGYGGGVNAGVRAASGDVVIFCNDDVRFEIADVAALRSALAFADVAVPALVDAGGRRKRSVQALPSIGRIFLEWALLPDRPLPLLRRMLRIEKWRLPVAAEVIPAATAAVVAAPRELLEDLPIPTAYFLYWEESEWFWWLHSQRRRVVYEPAARCMRVGGREEVSAVKSSLMATNALRCVERTQGRNRARAAVFVVLAWQLRLVGQDVLRRAPCAQRKARRAGLAAAWRAARSLWSRHDVETVVDEERVS